MRVPWGSPVEGTRGCILGITIDRRGWGSVFKIMRRDRDEYREPETLADHEAEEAYLHGRGPARCFTDEHDVNCTCAWCDPSWGKVTKVTSHLHAGIGAVLCKRS